VQNDPVHRPKGERGPHSVKSPEGKHMEIVKMAYALVGQLPRRRRAVEATPHKTGSKADHEPTGEG